MKTYEFILACCIPWIFLGLIVLYNHVFNNHQNFHAKLKPSIHSKNRISLDRKILKTMDINPINIAIPSKVSIPSANNITNSKQSHRSHLQQQSTTSLVNTRNGSRYIYFDWPVHSDDLSYLNYKSLESFLACCYTATDTYLEVMILGKSAANMYKVAELLSKQTFSKYKRKGYRINTVVYSKVSMLFQSNRKNILTDLPVIGNEYFNEMYERTCSIQRTKSENQTNLSPISFWFYNRIAKLYTQGGEFYDLSWFHQSSLYDKIPSHSIQQGFYMISFCWDLSNFLILPRPSIYNPNKKDKNSLVHIDGSFEYKCSSSTILFFPQPQHPVLHCMLLEYEDKDSQLHSCNQKITSRISHESLRIYEETRCIKYAFDRCFHQTRLENQLYQSNLVSSINPGERHYLGTNISLLPRQEADWYNTNVPILWLGTHASSGEWYIPYQGTYLHDEIDRNNKIIQEYMVKQFAVQGYPKIISNITCNYYKTEDYYLKKHRRQASKSCALSFVIPGFMKAGSTYLFNLISTHPQVLLTLKGVAFKETGCYYREAMDKNRSHERMNCFPFVESQEAMTFGDGTVYYALRYPVAKLLKWDNPNIKVIMIIRDPISRAESHHRFSYEQYAIRGLGDMNVVVDIALAPRSRLDRIYKLAILVLDAYHKGEPGTEVLENFMNVATKFFNPRNEGNYTYQRAANTLFFSLYFHPIYKWDETMGMENMYIIEAEKIESNRTRSQLDFYAKSMKTQAKLLPPILLPYTNRHMTKSLEDEMSNIFRFIGLSPLKVINLPNVHKSLMSVPSHHLLNEKSRAKLISFYKPFNELLAIYLEHRTKKLSQR